LQSTKAILKQLAPLQGNLINQATQLKAVDDKVISDKVDPVWKNINEIQKNLQNKLDAILTARRAKSTEFGNGSNFVARHADVVEVLEMQFSELYKQCLFCSRALTCIYGITEAVPGITEANYLHKLGFWIHRQVIALENVLSNRVSGSICFSFSSVSDGHIGNLDLMKPQDFQQAVNAKTITFSLTEDHFRTVGISKPLIRSFSLFGVPKEDSLMSALWLLDVTLPQSNLSAGKEEFKVMLNRINFGAEKNEILGAHNLSPIGSWRVAEMALSPVWSPSLTGCEISSKALANIGLILNLTYQKI
jgi:hypothetical protein